MNILDDEKTHPQKRRSLAIARAVWTDLDELHVHDAARRLGYVDDVLAGFPVPVLSRKEREAIEDAAKRMDES